MIKYADREQIDRLLQESYRDVRDHALLTVMYWRGLRASEVGMLTIDDYHRSEGRLVVHRAKGSLGGQYLLSPQEKKALEAWIKARGTDPGPLFVTKKQKAISRQHIHTLVRRYAERAGWPPALAHPHTLRHSIAVHLVEQGVDLLVIRDWLGHKSINSTMIYAQLTNRVRDEAAKRLYEEQQKPARVSVDWSKTRRKARRAPAKQAESPLPAA